MSTKVGKGHDSAGFYACRDVDGGGLDTSTIATIITAAKTNAVVSASDNAITSATTVSPNTLNKLAKSIGVNRNVRRAITRSIPEYGRDLKVPIAGGYQSTVGVLTTALFAVVAYEDWHNNYTTGAREISILIDAAGVGMGIGAGIAIGALVTSAALPAVVGVGITLGAGYLIGKGTGYLKGKFGVN